MLFFYFVAIFYSELVCSLSDDIFTFPASCRLLQVAENCKVFSSLLESVDKSVSIIYHIDFYERQNTFYIKSKVYLYLSSCCTDDRPMTLWKCRWVNRASLNVWWNFCLNVARKSVKWAYYWLFYSRHYVLNLES